MQPPISDLASVFGIVAVLVAIVALVMESRRDRFALQADLLLRLDEKLHSPELKSLRRIAAEKLLHNENPNYELEEVLDYLSTIAFFYERKAIDTDLTYKNFSYWLGRYWLCGRTYVVEESRKHDPQGYQTLEKVAEVFVQRELKSGYPPFGEEILRAFLLEEARWTDSV